MESGLESRFEDLAGRVEAMEQRLARLEQGLDVATNSASPDSVAPAAVGTPEVDLSTAADVPTAADGERAPAELLPLYGRTLLIFAGAFLIRAVTEAGTIPQVIGTALGLVYALAWMLQADRTAPRARTSATFFGLAGIGIAFPLVWEATAKFQFLSPVAGAVALAAVAGGSIAVVARRNLHGLAWLVALGGGGVAIALALATKHWGAYVMELLLLATAFLVVGNRRDWPGLQWLMTLMTVAALAVMTVTLLVSPADQVATIYSPGTLLWLQLGWVLLFFGTLAHRTLFEGQEIVVGEAMLAIATLVSGFGGALVVTRAGLVSDTPLGITSLLLAAGGYAVSFAYVGHGLSRKNFLFYSTFALLVALVASSSLLQEAPLSMLLAMLALAAGALGSYKSRATLTVHSAVYLLASLIASGGLVGVVGSFAARQPASGWLSAPALLAIAVAIVAAWLPVATHGRNWGAFARVPKVVVDALVLLGSGALLVTLIAGLLWRDPSSADAALLAALRTGALAGLAVAAAWFGRQPRWPEASWLVYPLLVVGGIKLLLVDLPQGRPSTLVLSFVFYGAALILAPRISRAAAATAD